MLYENNEDNKNKKDDLEFCFHLRLANCYLVYSVIILKNFCFKF